jgi:hypothetical protein
MGNLRMDNFDTLHRAANFKGLLALSQEIYSAPSCPKFDVGSISNAFASIVLGILYISITCLILCLLFFFTRPKTTTKSDRILDGNKELLLTHYWMDPHRQHLLTFHDIKEGKDVFKDSELSDTSGSKINSGDVSRVLRSREGWNDPLFLTRGEVAQFRFRRWWKRGRWLFVFSLVGTILSVVLSVALLNLYYQYFMIPSPASGKFDFCRHTLLRQNNYTSYFTLFLIIMGCCVYLLA